MDWNLTYTKTKNGLHENAAHFSHSYATITLQQSCK